MSTEHEVMSLLEEGNPATTVDDAAWTDMDASAYLTAITPASGLEDRAAHERLDTRPIGTRLRVAAAAALLALIAGAVVILLGVGTEEAPVVTEPPVQTTLPVPTTAGEALEPGLDGYWAGVRLTLRLGDGTYDIVEDDVVTDSGVYEVAESGVVTLRTVEDTARCQAGQAGEYELTLADDRLELRPISDECGDRGVPRTGSTFERIESFPIPESALDVIRPWGAAVSTPGVYTTTTFQPALTFRLPSNWRSPAPEDTFKFGMEQLPAWMLFNTQGADSVEERIAVLAQDESVFAGEPQPVVVDGAEGVVFEFTVTQDVILLRAFDLTAAATPAERIRVWILDVDGTVLSVFFGTTKPTFDTFVEDAETIVDSIVWG